MSGDLEAAPFGESHGGLFRSFETSGSGRYKLHGHVGPATLRHADKTFRNEACPLLFLAPC